MSYRDTCEYPVHWIFKVGSIASSNLSICDGGRIYCCAQRIYTL